MSRPEREPLLLSVLHYHSHQVGHPTAVEPDILKAVTRVQPARSTSPDPELDELGAMYSALPPPQVRWETAEGHAFLVRLQAARKRVTRQRLADAIGVSTTGLDKMLKKNVRRQRKFRTWPGPEDMKALTTLWARADARRPARSDPLYVELRHAIGDLLGAGFEIHEIALALTVSVGVLRRIVDEEPLGEPEVLARKVQQFLRSDERES